MLVEVCLRSWDSGYTKPCNNFMPLFTLKICRSIYHVLKFYIIIKFFESNLKKNHNHKLRFCSDRATVLQVGANCALLLATNVLGLTSYFLSDKQQRRAFLETRQSLEVKLLIEEQSAEQERLLLSVLPEHVAVKMRQDLGEAIDSQFKKIYMSRHENVSVCRFCSILYADIVGFTAISSTYSASELVKILNELFARFDRLAEQHSNVALCSNRNTNSCELKFWEIATIVSVEHRRRDLTMPFSVYIWDFQWYVQNTTNSPVDMRVGIHTGAVLAGVLGQRQWQFDVYSKDVELANKMESSGMKGRVHISERTLGYLDGHFEVEPGQGEKREEALRLAGIKTFFIVRALKPVSVHCGDLK
ncbi:hypothetical protein B566_EDAN001867 [Ephemera danica]|nr:hypothetical protein B566_EDAN001867 [Ephemera danica]